MAAPVHEVSVAAPDGEPPGKMVDATRRTLRIYETPSQRGSTVDATVDITPKVILTSWDLDDPEANELAANHEKSQDMFHRVLKHRGIISSSRARFVSDAHEADDHARACFRFSARILGRVKQRGIHGIRTIRLMCHQMDLNTDGTILGRSFEGALAHMGVRLSVDEYEQLVELFCVGPDNEEWIDYVQFIAHSCSNWSNQRQEVVAEAYDFLGAVCPGHIMTIDAISQKFKPDALNNTLVPELLEHHSRQEFLAAWNNSVVGADGVVSWTDFLDYYLDVSMSFDSEHEFCKFVCKCWGMDMDDWLAKKIFIRYAADDDENTMPAKDFIRMLTELDESISEEEALAWYEAIDEDESGEVSLEEFLNSKVLKVKRLFDSFDKEGTRTAGMRCFMQILHSLNDSITEDEGMALFLYADIDGNGEISFCEFLENNLLKMLQIFDEFSNSRSRCFNEAEMKVLLRKLDPYLDDYDIHQIYKAIDTDGSGSICFCEFVESHVLRAKTLFDRYDTDRSRTLTQFKFRELMLEMDATLTTSQMEAIYSLVACQDSGKVRLGGFLNPNIMKLKLLFEKFDIDNSRYLDCSEIRAMLKELFKKASEKDVDILLETVCHAGNNQGITFTQYIQRFKEVSRKNDLIELAKRRDARARALSKGLAIKAPS